PIRKSAFAFACVHNVHFDPAVTGTRLALHRARLAHGLRTSGPPSVHLAEDSPMVLVAILSWRRRQACVPEQHSRSRWSCWVQPVLVGVGGNPFTWVQLIGADAAALSSEIFVGRCVQGASWHVTQSAVTTASAVATFPVESCENSPGPFISFTSGVTLAGLSA